MPELPEVETVVRSLLKGGMTGKSILGEKILSADLLNERTLAGCSDPDGMNHALYNKTVDNVSRRGKYIIISAAPAFILIHLRMSGILRTEPSLPEKRQRHDRFILNFQDGTSLYFKDTRKFGRVWVTDALKNILCNLGIEPFSRNFTAEWLYQSLQKRKRILKPLLLDQTFIAGLGNIYTDESLFEAGIDPRRNSADLTHQEAESLARAIRKTLRAGIAHDGASIDWVYSGGHFQNYFNVYQREGQKCPRCGSEIQRIVVGQRGTHFCPGCQK